MFTIAYMCHKRVAKHSWNEEAIRTTTTFNCFGWRTTTKVFFFRWITKNRPPTNPAKMWIGEFAVHSFPWNTRVVNCDFQDHMEITKSSGQEKSSSTFRPDLSLFLHPPGKLWTALTQTRMASSTTQSCIIGSNTDRGGTLRRTWTNTGGIMTRTKMTK